MIEQDAVVTRVENDRVWVAAMEPACKACQNPCATAGFAENPAFTAGKSLAVVTNGRYSPGDTVTLEVPEGLLIKASLLIYLLPLLGFLAGALLGGRLGLLLSPAAREPLSIFAGLAGLFMAFALIRVLSAGKADPKVNLSIKPPR